MRRPELLYLQLEIEVSNFMYRKLFRKRYLKMVCNYSSNHKADMLELLLLLLLLSLFLLFIDVQVPGDLL